MDKKIQERQVRRRLQEYATRKVPDDLSLWPHIQPRIQPRPSAQAPGQPTTSEPSAPLENSRRPGRSTHSAPGGDPQRRRQPMLNLGIAGLVAFVITVGVAAFTLWLLPQGGGPQRDAPGNFGSAQTEAGVPTEAEVPIRQSVNGYTVNLYPFYGADSRIVVTYTVTDPQGNNVPVYKLYQAAMNVYYQDDPTGSKGAPKLRDDRGREASWLGSRFAWSNPSRPEEQAPVSDIEAHKFKALCCLGRADVMRLEFSPATNGKPPAVRNMHLEAPIFLPRAALTPVAEPATTPQSAPTQVSLTKIANGTVVDARLIFDFPLRSDPTRRVLEVNQAVEAAGVTVTLEKVVVTSREIYLSLRYGNGQTGGKFLPNGMQLAVGDWTASLASLQDSTFYAPPLDQQGEWTLTIKELVRPGSLTPPAEEFVLSGPWVFKFVVPSAAPTP